MSKAKVEEKTYNLWCANGDTCTLPLGKFWSEASGRVTYNAKQLKGKYCRIKNNKVNKNHTWELGEGGLTCKKTPVGRGKVLRSAKKPVKKPTPVKKPVKKPTPVKKPVGKKPAGKKPAGKKPAKKSSGSSVFRRWGF